MINSSPEQPKPSLGQRTVGELVSSIRNELVGVVHQEVDLAKRELKVQGIRAGIASAGFIVAAVFLISAWFTLLCAFAWGLVAAGLPGWASFLIVTAVLVLIAALAAFIGYKKVTSIQAPERTIATVKGAAQAVRGQGRSSRGDYDSAFEELYGKQVEVEK
ncbi:phage holin family protein [Dermabacteraceae bacterium P7074]